MTNQLNVKMIYNLEELLAKGGTDSKKIMKNCRCVKGSGGLKIINLQTMMPRRDQMTVSAVRLPLPSHYSSMRTQTNHT